jgi:hypothetical protein
LFYAVFLSICGGISLWWLAPRINIHSIAGLPAIVALLLIAVANAAAGIVGFVAAGVLFIRNRIVCWRGVMAAIIAAGSLALGW